MTAFLWESKLADEHSCAEPHEDRANGRVRKSDPHTFTDEDLDNELFAHLRRGFDNLSHQWQHQDPVERS